MKKKITLISIILILLILDFILGYSYVYKHFRNKRFLEKHDVELAKTLSNSDFSIDKIMLYTSASGINKNKNFQETHWVLDIFEYTDIAICFKKPEHLLPSNTVQNLKISNVKLNVASEKFTPSLYYLDSNKFGTDNILENYKIDKALNFNVLNFDNKDNSIMYNTPVFFSDLSNPLTLKFTNMLIKNHSIDNTEKLTFDGSLLSKIPIKKDALKASLSFDIIVTNFENKKYFANINIEIPQETDKLIENKMNLPLLREI